MVRTMIVSLALSLPLATAGHAATVLPDFSSATFIPGTTIDNRYFPLQPGYKATIQGSGIDDNGDVFTERSELSYAGAGPVILGVQTFAMQDLAFDDDLLVEATLDYYAQDTGGNVWYFGEDVTNYVYDANDNLVSTNSDSAWIAGQNGALPGYIMPANPTEGFSYFQEFASNDGALDEAVIWDTGLTLTVDGILFTDVLVTYETTQLDPEAREFKYYAPGVGLIRVDEGLDANLMNPDLVLNRLSTPAPVPIPPALPLSACGLAALAALRVRRRVRADSPSPARTVSRYSAPAPG